MTPPTEIKLHKKSKTLEIKYADGQHDTFEAEFLRVYTPSAEVAGHGNEPRKWIIGKQNVGITNLTPVGQYALRIIFDDGHQTGLYTWEMLKNYGKNQKKMWQTYLNQVGTMREIKK